MPCIGIDLLPSFLISCQISQIQLYFDTLWMSIAILQMHQMEYHPVLCSVSASLSVPCLPCKLIKRASGIWQLRTPRKSCPALVSTPIQPSDYLTRNVHWQATILGSHISYLQLPIQYQKMNIIAAFFFLAMSQPTPKRPTDRHHHLTRLNPNLPLFSPTSLILDRSLKSSLS